MNKPQRMTTALVAAGLLCLSAVTHTYMIQIIHH
jgi:hypothetical protein